MKRIISIFILLAFLFPLNSQAQANVMDELKNTCEVSGGTWTESGGGNWACCWSDWGCYGCVGGVCKIKCHNQRCRDANQIRPGNSTPTNPKLHAIEGLAPAGSMAPVIPTSKLPKVKQPGATKVMQ